MDDAEKAAADALAAFGDASPDGEEAAADSSACKGFHLQAFVFGMLFHVCTSCTVIGMLAISRRSISWSTSVYTGTHCISVFTDHHRS